MTHPITKYPSKVKELSNQLRRVFLKQNKVSSKSFNNTPISMHRKRVGLITKKDRDAPPNTKDKNNNSAAGGGTSLSQ